MMTPKFLREEAARFRGMAGTAHLEASKVRLLAMATDFESRATADDELIEPKLDEGIKIRAAKKIAKELNEPAWLDRHGMRPDASDGRQPATSAADFRDVMSRTPGMHRVECPHFLRGFFGMHGAVEVKQ
jgi:hypothetical protein